MHIRFNGIEAGGWGSLRVVDVASPEDDLSTSRFDVLGGDGQIAGPDALRKAVWNITLLVNTYTYEDGMNTVARIRDAWWDSDIRYSNDMYVLEYSKDGSIWYRVYGRPVNFGGPPQGTHLDQGVAYVELQFEQLDVLHYSSAEHSTRVNVVAARTGTGFRAPLHTPVRSTMSGGEPRAGVIRNAGNDRGATRIVFHGPCSDPRVWGDGFEAGYRGRLAFDETFVLDGRSKTATLHNPGLEPQHLPGRVTRKTRLSQLDAPPGDTALWFDAQDTTGTSYVDIFWRDTFTSMQ